ncbi:MAG: response regulator transcription factor [bacterium]
MSPNRVKTEISTPEPADDIIERIRSGFTSPNGSLARDGEVELRRALVDLANRIDQTVEILRQLVQLVHPQGLSKDLSLTPRELEMLGHLAEGRSNAEIAKQCWVSENTVKFHLKNLFRKLRVRDRGQAMMMARAIRRR